MSECPVWAAARTAGSRLAVVAGPSRLTYAALDRRIDERAAALARDGVGPGQRLVRDGADRLELLVDLFALPRLGAVPVPVNPRLTAAERARLFAQLPVEPAPRGVRVGLFTSGTTGTPRLVELTDGNFLASARASAANLGGEPDQRWLLTLPLFHVGGLAMVHRTFVYGASLVVQPGFDAARVSEALDGGVTHASLVPTTLRRLLDQRGARRFSGVRAVLVGGGPVGAPLLGQARAMGLTVVQTYGLTEACSQVTTERLAEADGETAGPPLDGVTVHILDGAGAPVPPGDVGTIHVSGPTVAPAYGPWLATGDLGKLDGRGRLTVLSRRTDLIISGGENIYPAELEAVLAAHPAVAEVVVVPRADERWGQVPVGVVVLSRTVPLAELERFAREQLAGFKVPRRWLELRELPRNAMGKVLRSQLVEQVATQSDDALSVS